MAMTEQRPTPAVGDDDLAPWELVRESADSFRVHGRAYTDPEIFRLEMKRIFERTWIFVGHQSEVAQPGDYKTTYVGLQPVIMSRDDGGEVAVMVNRCVHRGTVVCREPRGNANYFRCPYHGWVYGKDGALTGISRRHGPDGYAPGFVPPPGLHRLRTESYRGLVFATFNEQAPPLLEHLGRARQFIDRKINESPSGEIVVRSSPSVTTYRANWKMQSENITDSYHFNYVHEAFLKLQERYGSRTGDFGVHSTGPSANRKRSDTNVAYGCRQGHSMFQGQRELEPLLAGEFGDYYRGQLERYGPEQATVVRSGCLMFPSFGMIHHQLRVWRPIAPGLTELTQYMYELKDAPPAFNEGWLRSQERFNGPAGHGLTDDADVFERGQYGLAGSAVGWSILERGMASEKQLPDGDILVEPPVSGNEAPQRAFWRRWAELMADGAQKP